VRCFETCKHHVLLVDLGFQRAWKPMIGRRAQAINQAAATAAAVHPISTTSAARKHAAAGGNARTECSRRLLLHLSLSMVTPDRPQRRTGWQGSLPIAAIPSCPVSTKKEARAEPSEMGSNAMIDCGGPLTHCCPPHLSLRQSHTVTSMHPSPRTPQSKWRDWNCR
jgi:hypothetical protein